MIVTSHRASRVKNDLIKTRSGLPRQENTTTGIVIHTNGRDLRKGQNTRSIFTELFENSTCIYEIEGMLSKINEDTCPWLDVYVFSGSFSKDIRRNPVAC